MSEQYPALLVIVPLLSAFVISMAGWVNKRLCFPIAVAALAVAACSSVGLLLKVLDEGVIVYRLGGWDPPMGHRLLRGPSQWAGSGCGLSRCPPQSDSQQEEHRAGVSGKSVAVLYPVRPDGHRAFGYCGHWRCLQPLCVAGDRSPDRLRPAGHGGEGPCAPCDSQLFVHGHHWGVLLSPGGRVSLYCHRFIEYGRYCPDICPPFTSPRPCWAPL